MLIRTVAAAFALAIVLPLLVWGGVAGTAALVAVASAICIHEFVGMALPSWRGWGHIAVGLPWLCIAVAGWTVGAIGALVTASIAFVVLFGSIALRPGADLPVAVERLARVTLGLAWIGQLGWVIPIRNEASGGAWLALALVVPWCGDTGGYIAGRWLGRTPMHPAVSPKKTMEGAAGSIMSAAVGAEVVRWLWLSELPLGSGVLLGAMLAAVAIVGDLAESMLKRAWGVKDTGAILPGHGGLLDRIDSVLFVAPWVYLVCTIAGEKHG